MKDFSTRCLELEKPFAKRFLTVWATVTHVNALVKQCLTWKMWGS